MSVSAAADLEVLIQKHQSRQWQNEILFWLHAAIIVGGLFMGLVLPFWAVAGIIAMHRLHLRVFNGCIISRWQTSTNGLLDGENYLSHMTQRLFGVHLNANGQKVADYGIMFLTLTIGWIGTLPFGNLMIIYIGTCAFSLWAGQACWRLRRQPKSAPACGVGSCEQVRTSDYSRIAGVPVELAGISYFAAIFVAELVSHYFGRVDQIGLLLSALTLFGLAVSLGFIIIQKQILKQLCVMCMNVHGANFCLTGIILFRTLFA